MAASRRKRAKRLGRALRRALWRQRPMNLETAKRLEMDGLIKPIGTAVTNGGVCVIVRLTFLGFLAALLCLVGINPYRGHDRLSEDADVWEQERRREFRRRYDRIRRTATV